MVGFMKNSQAIKSDNEFKVITLVFNWNGNFFSMDGFHTGLSLGNTDSSD